MQQIVRSLPLKIRMGSVFPAPSPNDPLTGIYLLFFVRFFRFFWFIGFLCFLWFVVWILIRRVRGALGLLLFDLTPTQAGLSHGEDLFYRLDR